VKGRRDVLRDATVREEAHPGQPQWGALPRATDAWDAWDAVRRDVRMAVPPEPPDAGVGKLAGPALDGRELGALRSDALPDLTCWR
jgi:hypothetical protein